MSGRRSCQRGRAFNRLIGEISADLGGRDEISSIEKALVAAFAGATIMLDNLNARIALGETVDPVALGATISSLVRVATRLGIQRRSRDVNPLADILQADYERRCASNVTRCWALVRCFSFC